MLMDMELFTKTNEVIAELQKNFYEDSKVPLDMVVMQDDKYRNTEFEIITYGLGVSQGLKSKKYYFNAINDENNREITKYIDEPVSYYEHCGDRCMVYRVQVDTMRRQIVVFEIRYGYHEVQYHQIQVVELPKGKFASKVLQMA